MLANGREGGQGGEDGLQELVKQTIPKSWKNWEGEKGGDVNWDAGNDGGQVGGGRSLRMV